MAGYQHCTTDWFDYKASLEFFIIILVLARTRTRTPEPLRALSDVDACIGYGIKHTSRERHSSALLLVKGIEY